MTDPELLRAIADHLDNIDRPGTAPVMQNDLRRIALDLEVSRSAWLQVGQFRLRVDAIESAYPLTDGLLIRTVSGDVFCLPIDDPHETVEALCR